MPHLLSARELHDITDEDEWNELIGIPSTTQTITTAAYTILADARVIVLNPDADYTMTSTPTITDGTYNGQLLRVICANGEGNTVTFQDEDTLGSSNLDMKVPLRTLTGKEVMVLLWDDTNWVEQGNDEFAELFLFGPSPALTLKNLTAEDSSGGRESTIVIKGIQSGDEETILGWIRISHDGAADDEKGKLEFYLNDGDDGDSPTLRLTIDSEGTVTLANGVLALAETTTPSAVGSVGKFYTNNNNEFHFQDGAGVDRRVSLADYAGIYASDNAVATTILLVDAFEPVTIFTADMPELISDAVHGSDHIVIGNTGVYKVSFFACGSSGAVNKVFAIFAFEIAASGSTISGATQANPCVITATSHGFTDGQRVKIVTDVGMDELDGQIYTVAGKTDHTFELNDDNGADIDSTGYVAYTSGGVAYLATRLDQIHVHRKFAIQDDVGDMNTAGLVSLTAGNTLEMHVKCLDDDTNITFCVAQFWIEHT